MRTILTAVFSIFLFSSLFSQQLFIEAFSGLNRTAYDLENYAEQDWSVPIGLRVAGGLEHVQIGAEYHFDVSKPSLIYTQADGLPDIRHDEFSTKYYGGFLRFNLSNYPAFRFGVILKAGAGIYQTEQTSFTSVNITNGKSFEYDNILGFNGGLGFSIPMPDALHIEIGYLFNYVQRPEFEGIPAYNAFHHSIQAGLSWNMVFGEAAKRNNHLKGNWKWRNGWRG